MCIGGVGNAREQANGVGARAARPDARTRWVPYLRTTPAERHHVDEVPYAIAVVRLREGVSLIGRVVDIPLETLAIGLPVRFRPLGNETETSIGFGPT